MASVYVTQAGAGSGNGTSLANAFSAAAFNTAANWGGGGNDIDPGDVVYLSGTFTTRLAVQGSGTSAAPANRITLTVEPGSSATLVGLNGGAFDYIAVIGLNFVQTSTANNYPTILLAGCTGWLIQNNFFGETYLEAVNCTNGTTNSNNIVRRNSFENNGGVDGGSGGGSSVVSVQLLGNSNLIEYNETSLGLDRIRCFGSGNVARNNALGPTDTPGYPNTSPYPFHTDDFQSYDNPLTLVKFLWDRNYGVDNVDSVGGTNAHWMNIQDTAASGFGWYIFRNNLVIHYGGGAGDYRDVDRIYGYNNTFSALLLGSGSEYNTMFAWDLAGGSSDISDWRNNAVVYSPNSRDTNGIWSSAYWPTNFTSAANFAYNTGAQSVLPTGASPANLAQIAPLFTNADGTTANVDYTLQLSSSLRAAGAYITLANGSGSSSTSLTVDDSKRLFDGWGIADADFIKIGSGAEVQIVSIDYDTHVVTLASARTWSDNDVIVVRGTADVGALPYGSATAPAIASGVISDAAGVASVVVSDAYNVRFVELTVDGIPVATQYSPSGNSFGLTWSGDSNPSHVFKAVAYSAWASATPTVELQIYVDTGGTPTKNLRNPASLGGGSL